MAKKKDSPRYKDDYVEVRISIRKTKDFDLFEMMKQFPEVRWDIVCKQAIENYMRKRVK